MNYTQVIKKALITEKSMTKTADRCYTFLVAKKATKSQIKKAVEEAFKVNVDSVKTLIVKGKSRRSGRRRKRIKLGDWKKTFVYLKEGEKIEEFESQK